MNTKIWIDYTGKRHVISQMETGHLKNCIRFIDFKVKKMLNGPTESRALEKAAGYRKVQEAMQEIVDARASSYSYGQGVALELQRNAIAKAWTWRRNYESLARQRQRRQNRLNQAIESSLNKFFDMLPEPDQDFVLESTSDVYETARY